jgi:hypothetical protein
VEAEKSSYQRRLLQFRLIQQFRCRKEPGGGFALEQARIIYDL